MLFKVHSLSKMWKYLATRALNKVLCTCTKSLSSALERFFCDFYNPNSFVIMTQWVYLFYRWALQWFCLVQGYKVMAKLRGGFLKYGWIWMSGVQRGGMIEKGCVLYRKILNKIHIFRLSLGWNASTETWKGKASHCGNVSHLSWKGVFIRTGKHQCHRFPCWPPTGSTL